ncbi:MAG: hypothetical protein F6K22_07830 [Okeania sp. SIO2F4]|nr:hypothetical protein [Okeania sp. SIO2F4]
MQSIRSRLHRVKLWQQKCFNRAIGHGELRCDPAEVYRTHLGSMIGSRGVWGVWGDYLSTWTELI